MNKKIVALSLGFLAVGSVGSIALQTSAASSSDFSSKISHFMGHANRLGLTAEEKAKFEAFHTAHRAIMDAIISGDYAAFHTAVANNVKASGITEDQFKTLLEAHKIMEDAELMGPMRHGMRHGIKKSE